MAIARELSHNIATEQLWWRSYVAMNEAIANRIVEAYQQGDVIMCVRFAARPRQAEVTNSINGYHLMLVPALIRAKLSNASISFFLHVAFPSSELFRCIAQRVELLTGMLGADLVGFQTFQCVSALLMSLTYAESLAQAFPPLS